MAVVKTKKPSSKLKAGKKKKVNKWLIVGGIAAVAIIGVAVVRFSSASTWYSIWGTTEKHTLYPVSSTLGAQPVTITKGSVYRFCARGSSQNKTTVRLSLSISDLNGQNARRRASATKSYGKGSELHCSAEFRATKSHRASYELEHISGGSLSVTGKSIDYLR